MSLLHRHQHHHHQSNTGSAELVLVYTGLCWVCTCVYSCILVYTGAAVLVLTGLYWFVLQQFFYSLTFVTWSSFNWLCWFVVSSVVYSGLRKFPLVSRLILVFGVDAGTCWLLSGWRVCDDSLLVEVCGTGS